MGFNAKEFFTPQRLVFILLFAILGFLALQLTLFRYEGLTGKFFTWFELLGPLPGAFLGPIPGALATFLSRVINVIVFQKPLDVVNTVSLFTLAAGAFYFGVTAKENSSVKQALIIPFLAILVFLASPVGWQVSYFALLWVIPILASLFFRKHLLARALGATFTAHSVGGALWIWFMPIAQNPAYWNTLLFIVPVERGLYAIGIAISFIVFNTVLAKFESLSRTGILSVDKRYVLGQSQKV